jgi:hypothetical protein
MKDGKPEGDGLMRFPDGRTLSGEFHAGLAEGSVVFTRPDGFRYEGEWLDGGEA